MAQVTGWNQSPLYLTPEELGELDAAIVELIVERFGDRRRRTEDTPERAERVEILTFAYRL